LLIVGGKIGEDRAWNRTRAFGELRANRALRVRVDDHERGLRAVESEKRAQ